MAATVTINVTRKNSTRFSPARETYILSDNILFMFSNGVGTTIVYDNPQSSVLDQYDVEEDTVTIGAAMTMARIGNITYNNGVTGSLPAVYNNLRVIEETTDPNDPNTEICFFDAGRNHTANLKELHIFKQSTFATTKAITAVDVTAGTFSVATDLTSVFVPGKAFAVTGSTGNDRLYTVVSSTFGAATVITVKETIADATVDGSIQY